MAAPKPKLPPPVKVEGAGQIKVIVSGRMKVTSNDPRVVIERKD